MRSERKKGRAFLARFMVLMMIINLLSGINPSVARAEDTDHFSNTSGLEKTKDGITITEKALNYNKNDGTFDVKVTVEGDENESTETQILDVVLVVDTSGSMKGKRLTNAKKAAKQFVQGLISGATNNNVKVSVVEFADYAIEQIGLTNDINALNRKIDRLKASGATYTQDGLKKAKSILAESNAQQKRIVLISDGMPTYGYDENELDFDNAYKTDSRDTAPEYEIYHKIGWNWYKGYSSGIFSTNYRVYKRIGSGGVNTPAVFEKIKNRLYAEADYINETIPITSIGIGVDNNTTAILKRVSKDGKDYHSANDVASNLSKILNDLVKIIKDKKVNNGRLIIPMPDEVQYNGDLKLTGYKDGNTDNNILNGIVQKEPAGDNKVLSLSGLTLGKNEKLELAYKAKLPEQYRDNREYDITKTSPKLYPYLSTKENDVVKFNDVIKVHDNATISITVNKKWFPAPVGQQSVSFAVFADNTKTSDVIKVEPNATDGGWTGKIEKLPKYNGKGKAINYTIEEQAIDGYKSTVAGPTTDNDGNLTFEVTNKSTEKINITVNKKWIDPEGKKGKIEVQACNDKEVVATSDIDTNKTSTTLLVDKFDKYGKIVNYTVKEKDEINKQVTLNGNKFNVEYIQNEDDSNTWTIVNKDANLANYTFNVSLTKKWDAWNGETPEKAVFNFYNTADITPTTNPVLTAKLTKKDNVSTNGEMVWKKTDITLPKYDADGNKVVYTVKEVPVPGFETSYDNQKFTVDNPDITVTNKRTLLSENELIKVQKKWGNTPAQYQADSVDIVITGTANDKEAVKIERTLKKTDNYSYNSKKDNLPECDLEGNEITYSVKEKGQKNNKVTIGKYNYTVEEKQAGNNWTFTNEYDGTKTDKIELVTITKKWVGGVGKEAKFVFKPVGNAPGLESVEVTLKEDKGDVKVSDNGNTWTLELKNELREFDDNGKLAKYKVEEVDLSKAFTSTSTLGRDSISANGIKEVTFTNTRKTGKLTLIKKWVGKIGEGAEFTITPAIPGAENGKITLKKTDFQESSNTWTKVYNNVPVYDVYGNDITYKITEKEQEGYKTEGEKTFSFEETSQTAEVTFINTNVAANTYTITKVWEAGKIPENVSFGLFDENGAKIKNLHLKDKTVETIVLNAEDELKGCNNLTWQKTFTTDELPTNVNYTVKELKVTLDSEKPVEDIIELNGRTYKVASKNSGNNYTFTNTDITKGTVEVTKVWNGTKVNGAKFALFKTGEEKPVSADFTVIEDKVKFTNVPFTDNDHNDIENTYSIKELDGSGNVLADKAVFKLGERKYEVSYSKEGKTITNTELIDITVKKEWADNVPMSERKSVQVEVFDKNNFGINEIILDGGGDGNTWDSTLEELPAADGPYTVEEVAINDIDVGELNDLFKTVVEKDDSVTGKITFTITNSFNITPPKDDNIKVVKNWGAYTESKPIKVRVYKKTTDGKWMIASEETSMSGQDAVWEKEIKPFEEPAKPLIEDATNNKNTSNVPAQVVPSAKDEQTEMALPKEPTVPAANTSSEVNDTQVTGQSLEGDEPTGVINESEPQLRAVADPLKDYYVVETAVGDKELTNDEIESILNSMAGANKEGKYKIDNYDVHVQHLDNHVAFIKNTTDNELTEITVNKTWENTPERYQKPVKVQLYIEDESGNLTLSGAARTLSKANKWTTKFKGLSRYASDRITEIKYHIAETEVDNESYNGIMDANVIKSGYQIGEYKVKIDGDGTEAVTITNDINKTDISVRKAWASGTTQTPVVLSLYDKKGSNFNKTNTAVTLNADNKWVYTFEGLDKFTEDGTQILYYVFETKVGDSNYDAATDKTTAYEIPVGTSGKYNVTVTDNGVNENTAEKPIVITNSYTANTNHGGGGNTGGGTGSGDNPGGSNPGSNPGTEPVVPVQDPTPAPTPDTTPTVDVPDDTTPQGDANINPDTDNDAEDTDDADDDDVLEVDNDDVPQGTAKTKDDAVKEDPIDVDGDPTPRGNANLPKTGGTTADFLSIIGLGLVGLGLVIKRRK